MNSFGGCGYRFVAASDRKRSAFDRVAGYKAARDGASPALDAAQADYETALANWQVAKDEYDAVLTTASAARDTAEADYKAARDTAEADYKDALNTAFAAAAVGD